MNPFCSSPKHRDSGSDIWTTGCKKVDKAYEILDQDEARSNIANSNVPALQEGWVGVLWGRQAYDQYQRFAQENEYLEIDLSDLTVEVLEILLGDQLCKMEKLAIGGGFVGASVFVNSVTGKCFMTSMVRHPECLGQGRTGLSVWEVVALVDLYVIGKGCVVLLPHSHFMLNTTAGQSQPRCTGRRQDCQHGRRSKRGST